MSEERLFADEELQELAKPGLESVLEAIDAGDSEKAKRLITRMHKEWLGTHDVYRDWITAILTFIGRRFGDKALYEAFEESLAPALKPLMEFLMKGSRRDMVEGMAAAMRGHLGAYMKIEEDEEKFTFLIYPCPSGGRMVSEGCYGPSRNFLKVAKPQPMTYGRADLPVYCVHCAFQDSLPIDWSGEPVWLTEPAEKLGQEPCRRYVYKRARDIPARFYERVGKEKPTWRSS